MESSKFKSRLFVAFGQVTALHQRAQSALARLRRSIAETLQRVRGALRSAENTPRKLRAISRDAIVVMNHDISKFRSRFSIVLELMATHLRRAQGTLTRLRGGVADRLRRLRWVLRSAENELRKKVVGSCRDAIAAMNHRIRTFRWQLSNGFDQGTAHLRRAQSSLIRLVKKVIEKPTRVRQELRLRENELRELLASSLDAIVVTNDSRRFVAANPKALELFGVSEKNLVKFSIDVFLSGPILDFGRSGSSRISREEKHGKCKIRRLDGSLRVADCVFVPNFVPFQHLCRFCDITRQNRRVQIGRKTLAGPRQYASTQLR